MPGRPTRPTTPVACYTERYAIASAAVGFGQAEPAYDDLLRPAYTIGVIAHRSCELFMQICCPKVGRRTVS